MRHVVFVFSFFIFCHSSFASTYLNGWAWTIGHVNRVNSPESQKSACFRKPLCSSFLNQLQQDDRSDKLIGSDYSHVCEFKPDPRESIQTLEKSLRSETQNLLGETNFIPSQCSSSTDNSFDARKRLTRHYYSLARLAETQKRAIQQLGLMQKILGENTLERSPCDQFSYPQSVEACMKLKSECSQLSKVDAEKSLGVMASTTDAVMKEREPLVKEVESLENRISSRRTQEAEKVELRKALEQKRRLLVEVEGRAPWVLGEAFQKSYGKRRSAKEAIQSQMKTNMDALNRFLKDSEWATDCFKGYERSCDLEKVRKIIDSTPLIEPKSGTRSDRASLSQYYQYHNCVQTARIDYAEMNSVVGGTLVDAGLAVAGLFTFGSTTAVASERMLLRIATSGGRTFSAVRGATLALDLTANTANSYYQFQQAKEACREMVGLKNLPDSPGAKCEVASLQQSPVVMKNYVSCLNHAQLFFAGGAVFSVAAFKASFSAIMKSSGKEAAQAAKQEAQAANSSAAARRADDFTGVDHRGIAERTIKGFQGTISKTVQKIESLPFLSSLKIDVVTVKGLDGAETLHFKEPLKLADGTWVNSWPEIKIDQATGFLDANFPGGKQLFERIAKDSEGKAHLAFIDLGNLSAINKTFADQEKAGDAFLKEVSKVILEKSGGKASAARLGGDELGLIIHEADPEKAKKILAEIVETVRAKGSEVRKIFDEQKRHLVKQAKDSNTFEELQERQNQIKDFSKIQMPDLSIGLTKITSGGSFADHLGDAEKMATEMKIPNKLATGMPAEKYGSYQTPAKNSRPQNQSYNVRVAQERPAGLASDMASGTRPASGVREIQIKPTREVKRFNDMSLTEYTDEAGQLSYRVEKFVTDPKTGKRIPISREIPTRGSDHLIDGLHPETQNLAMSHFMKSAEPDRALVMLKLKSLRYLNYFASGTNTGDQMLSVVAQTLKTELKRDSDLKMKLGGSDFLASVDHMKPDQIAKLEKTMQKAIQESPVAQAILKKEKQALSHRIQDVKNRAAKESNSIRKTELVREAEDLKAKLKQVDNFDFQLELQSLRPEQVRNADSFDAIRKQLDSQFQR